MVTTKQLPILIEIIQTLKNQKLSIAELQRELKMKRSSLIYYLDILDNEGFLLKEKEEDKQGRPVVLIFNKKKYAEEGKKLIAQQEKERQELLKHPLVELLLKKLEKGEIESEELSSKFSDYTNLNKFGALRILMQEGYVKNYYKITPKGLKFSELKKNEKLNRIKTILDKKRNQR